MRKTTLAAMLLTLAGLPLQGEDKPIPDVAPGHVAWFDITTTSVAKSQDFYGKLFGWTFAPVAGAGADQAVEINAGGIPIGTLRVADGAISPFDGLVYVRVDDVRASCKKAAELGGKVVPGFPFNLPNGRGAIGIAADPAGHPIGMYSKTPLPAAAAK